MSDAAQGSRVGSQFGPYFLKRLLGRGGMGEVYEADDTVKERSVALKLLSPVLCQDPIFRQRLQREARMAGRLQEPHVVPVHDYGEIDGLLYVEMRLIDGSDLATLLRDSGSMTPPRAVAIVRQAAAALDAAHAAGVIHRDIKPENILITPDDFAYLVDFGIASATADEKLTSDASTVGTWKYAAPERFIDAEPTPAVDVYALACVLYECLAGSPPFRAESTSSLITAHLKDEIPRPSQMRPGIPTAFDEVIARGMAKEPRSRYASAGDLARAANHALSARDQDRAEHIVERSEEATLPTAAPRPTPPPGEARSPAQHAAPPVSHQPPGFDPAVRPGLHPAREARSAAANPWNDWHGHVGNTGLLPYQQRIRRSRPRGGLIAGAIAAAVLVVGLLIWLLPSGSRSPQPEAEPTPAQATTTTTISTPPPAESQARLFGSLPAGYPPGACNSVTAPPGALARVSCGPNIDPDGPPPSGTYTLFPDSATLQNALNKIVQTSSVLECPGRIQSPGAWHRIAAPTVVAGTLVCGIRMGHPAVEWTNNAAFLVGTVTADEPVISLDQLYGWWASHS